MARPPLANEKRESQPAVFFLICIWTRFGNACTTDRGTVYQNQESVYGIGYYVKNTRCPYLMDGVNPNNFGVGCTIWPDSRQCKLALNSFDIKCVEKKISVPPDQECIDIFDIKWDRRFERPDAQFHEFTRTFLGIITRKWTIFSVSTPNSVEESGRWGRRFSDFKVPESDHEEKKRLESKYDHAWDSIPQMEKERLRWKSTDTIAELYTPSWARLTQEELDDFHVARDPRDPNFIGYSLTEDDEKEFVSIEEERKGVEDTHERKSKEKSNDSPTSGRGGGLINHTPSVTTPKKSLSKEDLVGPEGGQGSQNLLKRFQEEINPAREGRTFTMEQMEAYAQASRLGFKVSFPTG